ncbi:hypothetical protein SADUNF_Sadunf04G0071000 [Salix dunnii]|nr:hypothetical protein SADUNF_Sadunf04G0071000 [Salix dunnii]
MELKTKNLKMATPVKDRHVFQSKLYENSNPNLSHLSPCSKPTNSPRTKSKKAASKNPTSNPNPTIYSPRNKIRERRFVLAKKNSKKENLSSNSTTVDCKCKERYRGSVKKCLCLAFQTLRASQEEFFKNKNDVEEKGETDKEKAFDYRVGTEVSEEEIEDHLMARNLNIEDREGSDAQYSSEIEKSGQMGSSTIKRTRNKLIEEARNSAPDNGKVKNLVEAFEKLCTLPSPKESDKTEEEEIKESRKKTMQWALPGLQRPKALPDTEFCSSFSLPGFQHAGVSETNVSSSSSFCPSGFFLTSENLGLDTRISNSYSWDGSQGRFSLGLDFLCFEMPVVLAGHLMEAGEAEEIAESGATSGRRGLKKKQNKITSQKPFKLRTEQRGRMKEEEFTKKLQEIMMEEEKLRIPIAQGLPWTTDEPECLIKPLVKENTRPIDLKLYSDIRAVERADFDHQLAEKMNMIEQYKMEIERQQKLAEEEEVRRLRKELVPKAQPMPYFDRPFIPRSSMRHPTTVPKEEKFRGHKKINGKTMATAKTVKDVSPHEFVKAYSAHLKRSGKVELPPWTDIVKTAKFKELAPYDPDWYYIRAASMARKIYLRGGLGVGAFRRIYGGSQRNGSRPPHFCKSSGSVARHILQQLQNMNIIDVDPKGGRRITSSGQRDLDQVAGRIVVAP